MEILVRRRFFAISFGYLLLPFIIFCLLFLKVFISLPISIILGFCYWRLLKQPCAGRETELVHKKDLFVGSIILVVWVLLSGIGGYMFQNYDHHIRNAIFHDLINFDWPVYYTFHTNGGFVESYALVYYIGFWLPAALVGKFCGWQIAAIILFFWTWLGVLLTTIALKLYLKISLSSTALLLIFFSGMDFLGTILIQFNHLFNYPSILPPITHLEWWARYFQFSSFTTQLFWVFNQAIPAWICTALLLFPCNRRYAFLIWSLCFFFAPLPALGLLPFILLYILRKIVASVKYLSNPLTKNVWHFLFTNSVRFANSENMTAILIIGISVLYYSANSNSMQYSLIDLNLGKFVFYFFFITIEGLFLWILLAKEQYKNLQWYAVGLILVISPLIRIGTSIDFSMRVSISALFMLMVFLGESLSQRSTQKYKILLFIVLAIGSLTPIYEINRSIYRTALYWFNDPSITSTSVSVHPPSLVFDLPEKDHPTTLTADFFPSLALFDAHDLVNYLGKTKNSIFFEYLAKEPSN